MVTCHIWDNELLEVLPLFVHLHMRFLDLRLGYRGYLLIYETPLFSFSGFEYRPLL